MLGLGIGCWQISKVLRWVYCAAGFEDPDFQNFPEMFCCISLFFTFSWIFLSVIIPLSAISAVDVILFCSRWYVIWEGLVHLHVLVSNAVWFFLIICFRTRISCAPSCGGVTLQSSDLKGNKYARWKKRSHFHQDSKMLSKSSFCFWYCRRGCPVKVHQRILPEPAVYSLTI